MANERKCGGCDKLVRTRPSATYGEVFDAHLAKGEYLCPGSYNAAVADKLLAPKREILTFIRWEDDPRSIDDGSGQWDGWIPAGPDAEDY